VALVLLMTDPVSVTVEIRKADVGPSSSVRIRTL
jgi:hypothetical protein